MVEIGLTEPKWSKLLLVPTRITAIFAIFLMFWHQIIAPISPSVQFLIFGIFIIISGIPHGAIDHLVAEETARRQIQSFKIIYFLARYTGLMLLYGCFWVFFPSLSLLAFLVISAWHFGETDIEKAPPTFVWHATRFIFGCFVLVFILLFHAAEVTPILKELTQNNPAVVQTWEACLIQKLTFCFSLMGIFVISYGVAQRTEAVQVDKNRVLRLMIILGCGYFLPLLVAFGLYFGGWHALCSFKNTHQYLSKNAPQTPVKTVNAALKTWSKTFFFTLLALFFLLLTAILWFKYMQGYSFVPPLFIFISLITLPHLVVMHSVNVLRVVDEAV